MQNLKPSLKLFNSLKVLFNKIPIINENEAIGLSEVLKSFKSKAIIVRPDRFVLETCKTVKRFSKFIKYFNKF